MRASRLLKDRAISSPAVVCRDCCVDVRGGKEEDDDEADDSCLRRDCCSFGLDRPEDAALRLVIVEVVGIVTDALLISRNETIVSGRKNACTKR